MKTKPAAFARHWCDPSESCYVIFSEEGDILEVINQGVNTFPAICEDLVELPSVRISKNVYRRIIQFAHDFKLYGW